MAKTLNRQPANQPNPGSTPPPEPKWRFRWGIVAALAAIIITAFLVAHIKVSVTWTDLMRALHVPMSGQTRYSQLCILGLLIVGVLLVIRAIGVRNSKD